jgi:hypothetical protein
MAKAVPLTIDTLKVSQITPQAATPPRGAASDSAPPPLETPASTPKSDHVPLQIRIPKHIARAIRVAAAERDQSISEFMLACFYARMKSSDPHL